MIESKNFISRVKGNHSHSPAKNRAAREETHFTKNSPTPLEEKGKRHCFWTVWLLFSSRKWVRGETGEMDEEA